MPPIVHRAHALASATLVTSLVACGSLAAPTEPAFDDADVRILFVGNSLTYTNDLPGVVATMAEAAGRSVATLSIVGGGYALEDHWAMGLAARIRDLRPDVVVLQQGPSSLPESRDNLVAWSDTVARVVREVGATPALLMVWPELTRFGVFDDVHDSYAAAATAVGGVFIPAGDAFRALHEGHPELEPYGADAFHPSAMGTVVSAYVVVRVLLGVRAADLPAEMRPTDPKLPRVLLTEDQARVLRSVADSVVDAPLSGLPPAGSRR